MKKILTMVMALIAGLLFAFCMTMESQAATYLAGKNGILTNEESKEIISSLQEIEKHYGIRASVYLTDKVNGDAQKVSQAMMDKIHEKEKDIGHIQLFIATESRDWSLMTDAIAGERITDNEGLAYIRDQVVPSLKESNWPGAVKGYVSGTSEMLGYYEKEGKAYTGSEEGFLANLGIAFLVALGMGFIVRKKLIASMSNVIPAANAKAYLDEGSFQLTKKDDTFLFMNVTRTKKEKKEETSESSGRSSSGSGGTGGKF